MRLGPDYDNRLKGGLPGHPALQVFGSETRLARQKLEGRRRVQVLAEVLVARKGRELMQVRAGAAQVFHPGVGLIGFMNNHGFLLVDA
jgi:hypothetical protein